MHQYGDLRNLRWYVITAVFLGWYISFSVVLILPSDVSSVFYRSCVEDEGDDPERATALCHTPWSYIPENVLLVIWKVIYWLSLPLTWLIFPIMESYVRVGEFTFWGKMRRSLKENILVYGSLGLIFGLLLLYIAIKSNADVTDVVMQSSNTWGLFLLVLLMGYGLVEVPRSLWNSVRRDRQLKSIHFKVAKIRTNMEDARDYLRDIISDVRWVSEKVGFHDPLRKYVDIIVKKCPVESTVDEEYRGDSERSVEDVTMATLVSLHRKLMNAVRMVQRTETQWEEILDKAFELEAIIENEKNPDRKFRGYFDSPAKGRWDDLKLTAEWWWKVHVKRCVTIVMAVVCTIMSLALIWSEATFSVKDPTLSIYAIIIHGSGDWGKYTNVEVISFVTLLYMSFCTYSTLFRVRFLDYYYFVPNHHTDQGSLIFSGLMLSRLTMSLCVNFLSLNHLDGHFTSSTTEITSFSKIMGKIDVVESIVNVYIPIAILLIALCTYFSLGSRVMACLAMEQFMFDDEVSNEYIMEGQQLIKIEKRRRERADRLLNMRTPASTARDKAFMNSRGERGSESPSRRIDDSLERDSPSGGRYQGSSGGSTRITIDGGGRQARDYNSSPSSGSRRFGGGGGSGTSGGRSFGRKYRTSDDGGDVELLSDSVGDIDDGAEFDSNFASNAVREGRFNSRKGRPQRNIFSDV
eukprot:Nk52_evm36s2152 gene=Nk52_evmTU36s2152